jgi:hypothetical protein
MTPATVRIPMHFGADPECLKVVLRVSGADSEGARIVRVRNTLDAATRELRDESERRAATERSAALRDFVRQERWTELP